MVLFEHGIYAISSQSWQITCFGFILSKNEKTEKYLRCWFSLEAFKTFWEGDNKWFLQLHANITNTSTIATVTAINGKQQQQLFFGNNICFSFFRMHTLCLLNLSTISAVLTQNCLPWKLLQSRASKDTWRAHEKWGNGVVKQIKVQNSSSWSTSARTLHLPPSNRPNKMFAHEIKWHCHLSLL